ncbi:MAG TPA: Uma2 family endonuclease [Verrucomicrobiae bacterium]|jgi:Uma2 family endonuclease|nr:Uma2 family endonuclease [Verrucomicrobiae bacterium]
MAHATPIRRLSASEYLQMERAAETKSEFRDGDVYAMAGGTPAHSRISANLIRHLGNRLEGGKCFAFTSDLRVKIEMADAYTYPDVSVVCGSLQTESGHDDVLLNPTVIVEVLSPSSESDDRGRKFELYRRIPSLREYLLVSQSKPHVEQFIRQASGEWLLRDIEGRAAALSLAALGIELPLAEVFAGVEFKAA